MNSFYSKVYALAMLFDKDVPKNVYKPIINRPKPNGFLEEELEKLIYFDEKGDYETRNKEFIILDSLLFDFKILESKNVAAFNKYKKLIKICSFDQYYGFRLEAHIAAILTSHNEKFRISESPDFIIEGKPNIFIECTSRHLNKIKSRENVLKSIRNSIVEKSKKSYCKSDTALFIDITNLMSLEWTILENGNQGSLNTIDSYVKETNFGNLILFSWVLHFNTNPLDIFNPIKYECMYWRFDNDIIDNNLKKFMDKRWPLGSFHIKTFHHPIIG